MKRDSIVAGSRQLGFERPNIVSHEALKTLHKEVGIIVSLDCTQQTKYLVLG